MRPIACYSPPMPDPDDSGTAAARATRAEAAVRDAIADAVEAAGDTAFAVLERWRSAELENALQDALADARAQAESRNADRADATARIEQAEETARVEAAALNAFFDEGAAALQDAIDAFQDAIEYALEASFDRMNDAVIGDR